MDSLSLSLKDGLLSSSHLLPREVSLLYYLRFVSTHSHCSTASLSLSSLSVMGQIAPRFTFPPKDEDKRKALVRNKYQFLCYIPPIPPPALTRPTPSPPPQRPPPSQAPPRLSISKYYSTCIISQHKSEYPSLFPFIFPFPPEPLVLITCRVKRTPTCLHHPLRMFPSSNRSNPFRYIDDENPNSGEDQPPSSFLHYPAAFLDDYELLPTHLLPQRQLMLVDRSGAQGDQSEINAAASNKTTSVDKETSSDVVADQQQEPLEVPPMKKSDSAKKSVPRKRTGKKDRHSKIYTAQGPRDRRMRLSLQIARKFFDLQDILGFDKASKTIEWLFTKSKAAIKELTGNLPQIKHIGGGGTSGGTSASSISESKGTSRLKEIAHNGEPKGIVTNGESSVLTTPKEKKNRKPRSKSALNPLAKESREKASARARERTREKMIMRSLEKSKLCSEANPNNLEQLVPSSPLETGEASGSRSQEMSASLEVVAEVEEPSTHSLEHQMATVGIIEKFLGIPSSSTSSSIFNYSPNIAVSSGVNSNNFPCFPGNWDIDDSRIHSGYSAMTNMGPSTGNFQDQNPTSVFMTTTNVRQQNPTSLFMTTSNRRLESQFQDQNSRNPLDGNKNHRLC